MKVFLILSLLVSFQYAGADQLIFDPEAKTLFKEMGGSKGKLVTLLDVECTGSNCAADLVKCNIDSKLKTDCPKDIKKDAVKSKFTLQNQRAKKFAEVLKTITRSYAKLDKVQCGQRPNSDDAFCLVSY